MNGQPFPEQSLIDSVQLAFPAGPSMDEVRAELSDLESEGFLSAHTDDLTRARLWTLTAKGQAKAVQLR